MRETRTPEQIRKGLQKLIQAAVQADGDLADEVEIGEVQPLERPDRNGCNWYIARIVNGSYHLNAVCGALTRAKARWIATW